MSLSSSLSQLGYTEKQAYHPESFKIVTTTKNPYEEPIYVLYQKGIYQKGKGKIDLDDGWQLYKALRSKSLHLRREKSPFWTRMQSLRERHQVEYIQNLNIRTVVDKSSFEKDLLDFIFFIAKAFELIYNEKVDYSYPMTSLENLLKETIEEHFKTKEKIVKIQESISLNEVDFSFPLTTANKKLTVIHKILDTKDPNKNFRKAFDFYDLNQYLKSSQNGHQDYKKIVVLDEAYSGLDMRSLKMIKGITDEVLDFSKEKEINKYFSILNENEIELPHQD